MTRVWTTDTVLEYEDQGSDTVYSAADYTLAEVGRDPVLLEGTEARIGRGGDFADTIYGNSADNLLEGHDDADSLFGNGGNDVLIGGGGDDILYGGEGDDTYKFGAGSDRDTVFNDGGGFDVVRAFQDVTPDAFSLSRNGNDVTIAVVGTQDRMWLVDWFGGSSPVQAIVFCGDTWDATEIADFANAHQLPAAGRRRVGAGRRRALRCRQCFRQRFGYRSYRHGHGAQPRHLLRCLRDADPRFRWQRICTSCTTTRCSFWQKDSRRATVLPTTRRMKPAQARMPDPHRHRGRHRRPDAVRRFRLGVEDDAPSALATCSSTTRTWTGHRAEVAAPGQLFGLYGMLSLRPTAATTTR